MSLRKSSSSRNGSKSEVLPKPNARRRCTPAPSSVGFAFTSRLIGLIDILILDFQGSCLSLKVWNLRRNLMRPKQRSTWKATVVIRDALSIGAGMEYRGAMVRKILDADEAET